ITFKDIYKKSAKIIIEDDGKGMTRNDLKNKWLFVAYSAKNDGTEDEKIHNDYREKIKNKRAFAGAKGVGRFSCDRLGKKLHLYTTTNLNNSSIEHLFIDWEKFEKDSKNEFINIEVDYKELNKMEKDITRGTVLEISNLRDNWDRENILKLKKSLEKLINPNEENGGQGFSIRIVCEDEIERDKEKKIETINKGKEKALKDKRKFSEADINGEIISNMVNGIIKNTIFEKLGIKTTQITSKITGNGKYIETILKDRGTLVYRIKESNIFPLSNINITLFFLDSPAKANFTMLMGIQPVNYGSVFVYKNGFRVYPYGEPGEDFFDINRRKSQGYNRNLGTRELMGRVEINGENDEFKETTSRDGGFNKNNSYKELGEYFLKTLRMLERYTVDVIKWGNYSLADIDVKNSNTNLKEEIEKFINRISNSKEILELEFDKEFIKVIKGKQEKSLKGSIHELKKHAVEKKDYTLAKKIEKIDKEYTDVLKNMDNVENDLEEKKRLLENVSEELKQTAKQNLFLSSVSTLDFDNIISLHHQIGIYANDINAQLLFWNRRLNRGGDYTSDEVKTLISDIGFLNKKILSVSRFATKANFNLQSEQIEADLITFIEDYINNIYTVFTDNPLNISLLKKPNDQFILRFKPIEVSIIIDNLISNSKKFKAKNIDIKIEINGDLLNLIYIDDGEGLNKKIVNKNKVFEKGFSTTTGSGLGLYHVKRILMELNGDISLLENTNSGFGLKMEVSR
ncbi:ATP-binding protein, partial [Bacillus sp. MM2020_1]|nr:ATP-binding protein [Bacillus sp. MM2020_1]